MKKIFSTSWSPRTESEPEPEKEREEYQQLLETCVYGYVLCDCGNCHCEKCNRTCRYETGYKPAREML